jgi:hypothetical protein
MKLPDQHETATQSREICGYYIDRELSPGLTFLAIGPGRRQVVLKRLDQDCLLGKSLHPSIAERLNRVRELAHVAVANLHGVVREGSEAFLVWEYVPGQTFDEYLSTAGRSSRELLVLAREIILHVESMHMQGIVHGSIVGSNIIVGSDSSVRLTHVSPLLYTEMPVDIESVVGLLRHAVQNRGEEGSPLGLLLNEATEGSMNLRTLGTRVAVLLESGAKPAAEPEPARAKRLRLRTLIEIVIVAVLGLALGWGVWRAFDGGTFRDAFHWIPGSPSAK